jgi:hypothetical protein
MSFPKPPEAFHIGEKSSSLQAGEQLLSPSANSTRVGEEKTMRSLPRVLFATCLLICNAGSFSQTPSLDQGADPAHELAEMTRRYKLDSDQRRVVKPILESQAEDLKLIASDTQLSFEQRGEKIHELRRVCNREIEAILHDRQRMLFDHDQK